MVWWRRCETWGCYSSFDLRKRTLQLIFLLVLAALNTTEGKVQHPPGTPLPTFGDPIGNITVIKDRDIKFTCVVKHLGQYKVGWVKADTKAIQAIHHQVVTHNPRVSVTYRDRTTWNLHIRKVQEDDRGIYMCQVNTDPMIAEMAYLEVVVPPQIDDNGTSGETEVEEGGSVTLRCKARGHPPPEILWQREGSLKIVFRGLSLKKENQYKGEELVLKNVKRSDMGPYLCIAQNGIPPSVSKRIMLKVHFAPLLDVPVHMIGSPLGHDVTIACFIESCPRAVITWRKEPGNNMIINSTKYVVVEQDIGYYVTHLNLTIKNFSLSDAVTYKCTAENSLGTSDNTVQVYEIRPQTPTVKKINEDAELDNHIPNNGPSAKDMNEVAHTYDYENQDLDNLIDQNNRGEGRSGGGGGGILLPDDEKGDLQRKNQNRLSKKPSGGLNGIFFFNNGSSQRHLCSPVAFAVSLSVTFLGWILLLGRRRWLFSLL